MMHSQQNVKKLVLHFVICGQTLSIALQPGCYLISPLPEVGYWSCRWNVVFNF